MTKIFRRLRSRFQSWRFYRAYPEVKRKVDQIEAARKAHRPTRHLIKAQHDDMLHRLREGM